MATKDITDDIDYSELEKLFSDEGQEAKKNIGIVIFLRRYVRTHVVNNRVQ